jgi:hypothetical protein
LWFPYIKGGPEPLGRPDEEGSSTLRRRFPRLYKVYKRLINSIPLEWKATMPDITRMEIHPIKNGYVLRIYKDRRGDGEDEFCPNITALQQRVKEIYSKYEMDKV